MGKGRGVRGVAGFALLAVGSIPASGALPTPGSKGAGDDYSPDRLYLGEQVLLVGEGGQAIPCAATDTAWAQLVRIQRSDDSPDEELANLREKGEIYEVSAGTEGTILEPSNLVPGVKLADGDRAGRICFTDRSYVKSYRRSRPYYWRY